MLRGLFVFGVGVYTGVYIAQNYQIQKLEDPAKLWDKFVTYVDNVAKEASKDGGKK